jgi:hypothetical protein
MVLLCLSHRVYYVQKHLIGKYFKGMPSVLNRVKIRGIRGLIHGPNSIFLEPFLDFDCYMDWGIVLYKYKIVIIVF